MFAFTRMDDAESHLGFVALEPVLALYISTKCPSFIEGRCMDKVEIEVLLNFKTR
jgi:hypothetical protein